MPTGGPDSARHRRRPARPRRGAICACRRRALAIHGISRSTLDLDLLVTDQRVLDRTFWNALPSSIARDIRRGDSTDPLAGVIRLSTTGQRDIDVVIGRGAWQRQALARVEPTRHKGRELPVASPADLILLKLYAGGSQDRWDIESYSQDPIGTGASKLWSGLFRNSQRTGGNSGNLFSHESRWARYPFPQLTLPDGPSAGMECVRWRWCKTRC